MSWHIYLHFPGRFCNSVQKLWTSFIKLDAIGFVRKLFVRAHPQELDIHESLVRLGGEKHSLEDELM